MQNKRALFSFGTALVVPFFFVTTVYAAPQSYTETCSIEHSRLDWRIDPNTALETVKECVLDGFDTSLGTLGSVLLTLSSETDTVQRVENKDVTPHTMLSKVEVDVEMVSPVDKSSLIELVVPAADEQFEAAAFDGTIDYSGDSGITFDAVTGKAVATKTYTSEQYMSLFSDGQTTFPVYAEALWGCSGSGNAACEVDTFASATIQANYTYEPFSPDLVIRSCDRFDVQKGSEAQYTVSVANQGSAATDETITVIDVLPSCLEYNGVVNSGWYCTDEVDGSGQAVVTCEFEGVVPQNAYVPDLVLSVKTGACETSVVTHVVRAATDGESRTENNSFTCEGNVGQVDESTVVEPDNKDDSPEVLGEDDGIWPTVAATNQASGDDDGDVLAAENTLAVTGKTILMITFAGVLFMLAGFGLYRSRKAD